MHIDWEELADDNFEHMKETCLAITQQIYCIYLLSSLNAFNDNHVAWWRARSLLSRNQGILIMGIGLEAD